MTGASPDFTFPSTGLLIQYGESRTTADVVAAVVGSLFLSFNPCSLKGAEAGTALVEPQISSSSSGNIAV